MKIIGVLSGTSVDGIDVALVDITDSPVMASSNTAVAAQDFHYSLQLQCYECVPFQPQIRQRILQTMNSNQLSARDFCEMNVLIGEEFARAIRETVERHSIDMEQVDLIGSHGQTIWHQVGREEQVKGTLQLGESSVIAAQMKKHVVDQFRVMDVALGGQGAPLTSIYDYLTVERHSDKIVIVNNVGGMSNATILPPRDVVDPESKLLSFDTGPGNIMIDEAVSKLSNGQQKMDIDGRWAASGVCNDNLRDEILSLPYFSEPIPKTTGREQFGTKQVHDWIQRARDQYQMSDADIICTFTHVTARSMVMAYRQAISLKYPTNPPQIHSITITGGGAHNIYLMSVLQQFVAAEFNDTGIAVKGPDDTQHADAKEAMLFALLAYLYAQKRNGNIHQVTGASHSSVLGKFTPYIGFSGHDAKA